VLFGIRTAKNRRTGLAPLESSFNRTRDFVKQFFEKMSSKMLASFNRMKESGVLRLISGLALAGTVVCQILSQRSQLNELKTKVDLNYKTLDEKIDKNFKILDEKMDKHFNALEKMMDKKCDSLESRIELKIENSLMKLELKQIKESQRKKEQ
jgi:hypothetical protein